MKVVTPDGVTLTEQGKRNQEEIDTIRRGVQRIGYQSGQVGSGLVEWGRHI